MLVRAGQLRRKSDPKHDWKIAPSLGCDASVVWGGGTITIPGLQ